MVSRISSGSQPVEDMFHGEAKATDDGFIAYYFKVACDDERKVKIKRREGEELLGQGRLEVG
jgi:hypothetical protein